MITLGTLSIVATASKGWAFSLIRDAEIEETIALYAAPIFDAAHLSADSVEIYLVKDNRLNAFVAGGQQLFIHTGLLQAAETPEQVIGVIAHEAGHIAGGHLARLRQKTQGISPESILSYVLGGVAALAGRGDVASGLIISGQGFETRSILNYTRTEEGSADQAATRYLDASQITSRGLLEFFQRLKKEEVTKTAEQNPYIRSHPLTQERITFLKDYVSNSPLSEVRVSEDLQARHERMRAKLIAYLLPSGHTFRLYPKADKSLSARYARAMAYHQDSQMEDALREIDSLIAEHPDDPYFHELKGQIYFENGKMLPAIEAYKISDSLLPNHPLMMIALGRAYLESQQPALLNNAISMLQRTVQIESENAFAWRQLGIAYGKSGQSGLSDLALAEEAYLRRRFDNALFLAGRAETQFKTGSPEWLRAEDIRLGAERLKKKQNNR